MIQMIHSQQLPLPLPPNKEPQPSLHPLPLPQNKSNRMIQIQLLPPPNKELLLPQPQELLVLLQPQPQLFDKSPIGTSKIIVMI